MTVVRRQLGALGAALIRTNLELHAELGAHLGRLLGGLPIERGATWALLPHELVGADLGLDPDKIDRGTLHRNGVNYEATVHWLSARLDERDPGHVRLLAFEEWIIKAEEVDPEEIGLFFCEGKVVDYALPGADEDTVKTAMKGFYPSVGILCRYEEGSFRLAERADVTEADLARLAAGTLAIIVAAFDDEGWIVWEPPG